MALTSKFFSKNRRSLFQNADVDLIVISANTRVQRSGDVTYPFRQNSYFYYLTGINDPDVILVIFKSESYLIMPNLSDVQKIFDGDHDINTMQNQSGITETHNNTSGMKKLHRDINKSKSIGVLVGKTPKVPYMSNNANGMLYKEIRGTNKGKKYVDIRPKLFDQRMVKTDEEIQQLQKAIDLTIDGFLKFQDNFKNMKNEKDIEALLTAHFIKNGAEHGYPPIVGSGKAACTLHYVDNNQALNGAQVLIDAGAEVNNYSADITRTIPLIKSKRFKEVFNEVMSLQEYAISILKPGITLKDYEKKVAKQAGKAINKLLPKAKFKDHYPHATSHHLGLDVHDVADYSKPLQKGNIITVEPGIYIPKEGIGVRIEDDVLITETGVKVLSKRLPAKLT